MKSPFQRTSQKEKTISSNQNPNQDMNLADWQSIINIPQFIYASAQSPGLQRDQNEDTLITLSSSLSLQDSMRSFGFFAIADGMGGHLHGEIASKLAIGSITATITEKILIPYMDPSRPTPQNSLQNLLNEAFLTAHTEVLRHATGGGTTLTACILFGSYLTIAHVGDTRAYSIGLNGEIKRYTRDHSLVNRLIELGQINEKQALHHPQRNVLYRALGQNEPLEVDINSFPIPEAGYLLICSDGLWSVISDQSITEIMLKNSPIQILCNHLIQAANEAGGPDNISVILVKFNG